MSKTSTSPTYEDVAAAAQRMGAFKFRGAFNALSARMLRMAAVILMPQDAPQEKVDATRGYGAEVITFDRFTQDRELLARASAAERGMTLISPCDHADIIAGQGTAAKELFENVGELDFLFAPLGGGGLLSGTALASRALSPHCQVKRVGIILSGGNVDLKRFAELVG